MPGFLWWDSTELAVFVEVEIIGAAGVAGKSFCMIYVEIRRGTWYT